MILIKELPELSKPREKAIVYGINNLSDDELLAIIIKNGYKGTSVKDLANSFLKNVDGLDNIFNCSVNRLATIKGIGKTKAISILAAIELGRRTVKKETIHFQTLNNANLIFQLFKDKFNNESQEEFIVILLDNRKNLIDYKIIFKGDLTSVVIHPREIFKYAIINNSASVILAHNHPSGDATPSKNDVLITKNLIEVGKIMQLPVLDHVIISKENYYSFYDHKEIL